MVKVVFTFKVPKEKREEFLEKDRRRREKSQNGGANEQED
jgi:hypothetical protein